MWAISAGFSGVPRRAAGAYRTWAIAAPHDGSLNVHHNGPPKRDPALAALEARLGWPAVMTEGCRWIIGEPGKGAWKWCGAPCIVAGSAGSATWCADHWRLVYLIGDRGVDPESVPAAPDPRAAANRERNGRPFGADG